MPLVMVVNPSVPANTVPEFIAYAKANPGKVNMASAGTGGGTHLAGELFKTMAGVNLVHVPYRSNGPALVALLGGQAEVLFPSFPSSIEYIARRATRCSTRPSRATTISAPRSAADKNPGRIIHHTRIHLAPSVNHSFSGLR